MKYRKGFNINLICSEIEKIRTTNDEMKTSYSGLLFHEYEEILATAISDFPNCSLRARKSIISKALFSPKLPAPITPDNLLKAVKREAAHFVAEPVKEYIVQFGLVGLHGFSRKSLSTPTCKMLFNPSSKTHIAKNILHERGKLITKFGHSHGLQDILNPTCSVNICCDAVSMHSAYDIAKNEIDELRALINLMKNRRQNSPWSIGGPAKPINQVVLGALQTVHLPNGKLEQEMFWYERDWQIQKSIKSIDMSNIDSKYWSVSTYIKLKKGKHSLSDEALFALRTYVCALDMTDWKGSFLQLWVLLEFLTNSNNANYDSLVTRCSNMFSDPKYMKQFAHHLRVRRNIMMHDAIDEDTELLVYQAKRLVEPILMFYITNPFNLQNRDEVGEFLSLPCDLDQMKRKRYLLAKGIRFRGPTN